MRSPIEVSAGFVLCSVNPRDYSQTEGVTILLASLEKQEGIYHLYLISRASAEPKL